MATKKQEKKQDLVSIQQAIEPRKKRQVVKTSIVWDKDLVGDLLRIMFTENNRSLSNFVETHMMKIRDKAKAEGVI